MNTGETPFSHQNYFKLQFGKRNREQLTVVERKESQISFTVGREIANPCPWVVFPGELKPGLQQAALPQLHGSKQSSPLQQGWHLSYSAVGQYRKVISPLYQVPLDLSKHLYCQKE